MIRYILLGSILMMLLPINCLAYDDDVSHKELTQSAVLNSALDAFFVEHLGLPRGFETVLHIQIPSFKEYDARNTTDGWQLTEILQEGARMEDSPDCRASNHFHNPVKAWADAGLTDVNPALEPVCSKWNDGTDPYYSNLTWATGLTSPGQKTELYTPLDVPDVFDPENPPPNFEAYTWDGARRYYRQWLTGSDAVARSELAGRALYTLGHVLHLLEDMGVPAHVRNEPLAREEA